MPNIDFPGSLNIVFVMCILMNLIFLHETETNSFIACWGCWRSSNSDWKPVPWWWKMASLKQFWHSQINWSPEIYYYMIVLSTFGPFFPLYMNCTSTLHGWGSGIYGANPDPTLQKEYIQYVNNFKQNINFEKKM